MLQTTEQQVLAVCDRLFDKALTFTQDMVRCYPVLNQEQNILQLVERHLQSLNLAPQRVYITEEVQQNPLFAKVDRNYQDKYNLVTWLNAGSSSTSLVLNGHLDVVPAEPFEMWTKSPNQPYIKDGYLYGRGAGDMLSGVAAMIYAVHAIQQAGLVFNSPLCIQTVIEEECTGNGTLACVHQHHDGAFVLIPEPFGAQIYSGQIGVLWFKVCLYGKPAHVLDTSAGVSAIDCLNQAVAQLKTLEKKLNSELNTVSPYKEQKHPYNLNVGKIQGGNWASSVPAYAEIEGRLGFAPGIKAKDMMLEIENVLSPIQKNMSKQNLGHMKVSFDGFRSEGHLVDLSHPGIELLSTCHNDLTKQSVNHYYSTCTSDLRAFYSHNQTQGTCYGPIAKRIHGVDECVEIESIRHTLKTYALFMLRWCSFSS